MRKLALSLIGGLVACEGATSADTTIGAIQGSGDRSPLEGESVTVTGVVTGDFQSGDDNEQSELGGFFLQQFPGDDDPTTSDGIFVYDGARPAVDVGVGDEVTVTGIVKEHFGETQVDAATVTILGRGAWATTYVEFPQPTTTNSDGDPIPDLERYEGMRVAFTQKLTVTALHELERYGSVTLAEGGRLFQFTDFNRPDPAGYIAHRQENASRSILLDDGNRAADARPIRFLNAGSTRDYTIRGGDFTHAAVGNLRYSRGSGPRGFEGWRLMAGKDPVFIEDTPRPDAPSVDASLKVASFNLLNFFSTLDEGKPVCGPRRDESCRGADSRREFERQVSKTVTAISMMDADIIGLMELENNTRASLQALVDALNERLGEKTYAFVDAGTIGGDVIKVGLIYRPADVTTIGRFQVLDNSVDASFRDDQNRPVLAQTFKHIDSREVFTVAVAHLKSKGSDCDDLGDPNRRDGQGNCAVVRTDAANALARWLDGDPTASGDDDVLVVGDFNSYTMEDPIATLERAGLVKLLRKSNERTYSFAYDGQYGALDHALASPALASQVADIVEWHINADEPRLFDYNLDGARDPGHFDARSPYRASDHDPLIVGIEPGGD